MNLCLKMFFFQVIFVILFHTTFADNTKEYYDVSNWGRVYTLFESFLQEHDKNYVGIEMYRRLYIFRESLKEINRLNVEHPSIIFGITYFADLTAEEMSGYKGFIPSDKGSCTKLGDPTTADAPAAYDWREHNAVTSVKNQRYCGSCWAFSATATVESKYAIKSGQQVDLSEQQLVDCDDASSGCQGGLPEFALEKLIKEGGQQLETYYPYVDAMDPKCQFNSSKVAVNVASCNTYNLSTEDAMKEVLFKEGSLSISVDATLFQFYKGGIINFCLTIVLNHAVLLVGYGTENGQDYWIIKNSWGTRWGENGYIRIVRGVQCCGLLNEYMASVTLA